MTQKVARMQLLLWECNEKHKPTNRNRDTPDFMAVPDQLYQYGSNNSTFSQIRQAVPEL